MQQEFFTAENNEIHFLNPPSINDNRYQRWMRDTERIQWFSIGNGYVQNSTEWIGKFEQEEFNCVIRCLLRFSWTQKKL